MGDMERNFDRAEFACKGKQCCGNSAPIARELVMALQELRDVLSREKGVDVLVSVRSGFRCLTHDREEAIARGDSVEAAAARRSQHCLGNAADVVAPMVGADVLAAAAERVEAFRRGGIGRYTGRRREMVHVDVRMSGPARWTQ